jgi:hypothetical protein
MLSFYIWLLTQVPEYNIIPLTQVQVFITRETLELYVSSLTQTVSPETIAELQQVLARKSIVFFFPEKGCPEILSTPKPNIPIQYVVPKAFDLKNVPVTSFMDLLVLGKKNHYLKVLYQGNYLIWGVSGFVISELVFLDLLYLQRMHSLALNPELPPLGINITDYVTDNGPLFPNKESKELACDLVITLGISLTIGLAAGCISYALTFVG